MEIKFFVPGTPKTAGSKRAFYNKKIGRAQVVEDCEKSKDWRASVQQYAEDAMEGKSLFEGPIAVAFIFILKRPQGHMGAKGLRPSAPQYPCVIPDVLKMSRAVEDALTGITWTDDARIVDEHLYKRYTQDGRTGCQIAIRTKS